MTSYKTQLKDITTFIFDVDGVLTDGIVIVNSDGEMLRTANVRDGYAMQLAVKKNYNVAIISGGHSEPTKRRFQLLGVKDVFMGVENKYQKFKEYIAEKNIAPENILYMGDDIPDYHVMSEVGLPTCPADACEEIKKISKYISIHKGGYGCVRDIIEQVMKLQGKWFDNEAFSW